MIDLSAVEARMLELLAGKIHPSVLTPAERAMLRALVEAVNAELDDLRGAIRPSPVVDVEVDEGPIV